MERIDVVHGDTDLVPVGGGTFGSRSLQQGGAAVQQVSIELVDRARELAAELLEADVDDVVLDKDAGAFHVRGTPSLTKSWAELAAAGEQNGHRRLDVESNFVAPGPTYPIRGARRRGGGRRRDGQGASWSGTSPATTRGPCSTHSSSRARCTGASPRAWHRR